jgi:uncharacterized protein
MLRKIVYFPIEHPKTIILLVLIITTLFASQFPRIKIDTDPENMLEEHQADRVYYGKVKKAFGINDIIVLGITDEKGIFNPETLRDVARITDGILKIKGVIVEDVISLTTTDNVQSQNGLLEVKIIMDVVPQTLQEAERLKGDIFENPLFADKIASRDGKGIAIYIPIQKKDMSYRISKEIEEIVNKELGDGQSYFIAGLPVAEDTFGHEMFLQMGITAPLTGIAILLVLFLLFRKLSLIISPMVVAMLSVIWGMGLLIGLGYTVHIMSSMIPIFLMPIAVLDSVHILSEFYDRYPTFRDRKKTLEVVIEELFTPMLYTSLTSAIGFGSLVLADIPPVQVFGVFVAFGIIAAWILTITLIPASIMLISEKRLIEGLDRQKEGGTFLEKILPPLGRFAFFKNKTVLIGTGLLLIFGIIGVSRIKVNDNPVKWFKEGHRIRVADNVMNQLFGGTYMAYLTLDGEQEDTVKRPEVMTYIERLQEQLEGEPLVGKTSSVADVVKRINYVLHEGDRSYDVIPESLGEIGQYLFLFLMSGDPNDLDNFVTTDYSRANIWVQMKGGDNKDMEKVELSAKDFIGRNPPPEGIKIRWSGLTYINKTWQHLMVVGMLKAILGSFAVVFVLMCILFRSIGLGLISMLPLTFSILFSYGIIGFIGKDYDMPIAICSSLSLGLSIDYAIHFVQRFRNKYRELQNLGATNSYMFGLPARAISRNAIVITLGFLPLVLATLTPYVTVGAFFASLMIWSAITTLLLLPALMKIFGKWLLKGGI